MNLKLWIFILFISLNILKTTSIKIKMRCNAFKFVTYFSEPEFHTDCSVQHLKVLEPNETISDIEMTGSALRFRFYTSSSNIKKTSISITSSVVYYLPFGLESELGNITSFSIKYSKLREIHQYNLEPFPELTTLSLTGNEIQVIELDLFKFNPKLEEIALEHNHIQHVEPNVFKNLKKLEKIYFNFNPCVMQTGYDQWLTNNITEEIYAKCKPRVDDSSIWKSSEEVTSIIQDESCTCSGLWTFAILLCLILIVGIVLIVLYFYKSRKMSIMEMKESLMQFSLINDQL